MHYQTSETQVFTGSVNLRNLQNESDILGPEGSEALVGEAQGLENTLNNNKQVWRGSKNAKVHMDKRKTFKN